MKAAQNSPSTAATIFTPIFSILALVALPALIAGCHEHPLFPDSIGGLYTYTAFSAGDTAIVEGSIVLVSGDSGALTGTWSLRTIRGATGTGPQAGRGTLTGSTADGISINLNPEYVDNNVLLTGAFAGDRITGSWHWITFAGESAGGRFEMKRP